MLNLDNLAFYTCGGLKCVLVEKQRNKTIVAVKDNDCWYFCDYDLDGNCQSGLEELHELYKLQERGLQHVTKP